MTPVLRVSLDSATPPRNADHTVRRGPAGRETETAVNMLATIATAWPLLAVAAGTIIGRSIRHADQQTTR